MANKTATITENNFVRAPVSMWVTILMVVATGSAAWATTSGQVEDNSENIDKHAEQLQHLREHRATQSAHYEDIKDDIKELKKLIRGIE